MMWLNRLRQPPPPIGCEIGLRWVRLAQLRRTGNEYQLAAACRAIPAPGSVAEAERTEATFAAIRDAVRDGGFAGRRVASCLSNDELMLRTLRLAAMPEVELLAAVQWKAAAEVGLKADQIKSGIITRHPVVEGGKNKLEVIAVTAKLEQLERHISILSSAGLSILAIDSSTCAVARCLTGGLCGAPASPPQLILELRDISATLAVASRGEVEFIRPVGGGIQQLVQFLAHRLGLDAQKASELLRRGPIDQALTTDVPADRAQAAIDDAARMYARDLAREVSLSLGYYEQASQQAVPEAAVIVGGEALPAEAISALALQTGVAFRPVESLPTSRWRAEDLPASGGECGAWLTSIGLSQYAEPMQAEEKAA